MAPVNQHLLDRLQAFYRDQYDKKYSHAPIITDIIAHQPKHPLNTKPAQGEFTARLVISQAYQRNLPGIITESDDSVINRMCAYIEDLVIRAAETHVENNFSHSQNYINPRQLRLSAISQLHERQPSEPAIAAEIKKIQSAHLPAPCMDPAKKNHITRLSLNEFALYPHASRGPLSLASFNKLIEKISTLTSEYPENIHLILASVPVIIYSHNVKNMVIHVQCGSNPIIHTFAKAVPHEDDPKYTNTSNPRFSSGITVVEANECARAGWTTNDITTSIADCCAHDKNKPASSLKHGGNIVCETAGGVTFQTIIDICFDHQHAIGKQLTENNIKTNRSYGSSYLPLYVSHVIVSNHTLVNTEHLISDALTHADSLFPKAYTHFDDQKSKQVVNVQLIKAPAFGSNTTLLTYESATVSTLSANLKQQTDSHNVFMIYLLALKKYREQRPLENMTVYHEISKLVIAYIKAELMVVKRKSSDSELNTLIADYFNHINNTCSHVDINHIATSTEFDDFKNKLTAIKTAINDTNKDSSLIDKLFNFISEIDQLINDEIKECAAYQRKNRCMSITTVSFLSSGMNAPSIPIDENRLSLRLRN